MFNVCWRTKGNSCDNGLMRTSVHPRRSCLATMCEPPGKCLLLCISQEHDVETPYGMLHVVIRGAPKGNKPAILTYHDVGLNREYCVGVLTDAPVSALIKGDNWLSTFTLHAHTHIHTQTHTFSA